MTASRAAFRHRSKSELAGLARVLAAQRETLLAASAWRWKRKLRAAAAWAFLVGLALGYAAAQLFP